MVYFPFVQGPDTSKLADLGQMLGQRRIDNRALEAFGDSVYGANAGQPRTLADLSPPRPSLPSQRSAAGSFMSRLIQAESGGDPEARNPRSTATGLGQFLDGTWNDLVDRYGQQLGLTPDGRTDPDQNRRALMVFTRDNAKALRGANIPVNDQTLYGAHFFGAGDAPRVFSAPDTDPLANHVQPATMQANPHLSGMTIGDAKQWLSRTIGQTGQGGSVTGGTGSPAATTPQRPSLPPREALERMVRSPVTRDYAIQLIQSARQGVEGPAFSEPFTDERGNLVQIGRDGQYHIVQGPQPGPDLPADVREYQFAQQQGYEGSFLDYQNELATSRRSQTTVSVGGGPEFGTIPQGYMLETLEGEGGQPSYQMIPIPGGPADLEQQQAAESDAASQRNREMSGNVVVQDIDRIIGMVEDGGLPETGLVGGMLSVVPGTDAGNIARLLFSIKSNVGFDRLQQMRDASPTGGALGQVSEMENRLLQSALGSLDQAQSQQQFIDNLSRVYNIYLDIIHGPGNGPGRRPVSFEQPRGGEAGSLSDLSDEELERMARERGISR